jgi:hypothetical protein
MSSVVLPELAELERSSIAEWVLAEIRKARAKRKRPTGDAEKSEILHMSAAGASWLTDR